MTRRLTLRATDSAAPPTADRLWSVHDTSAFLGVPVGTLYQWRTRHQGPPGYRVGRHLRYDPGEVRRWVADQGAA